MKKEEITVSRNGLFRLHIVRWTPDDTPPRAVIQIVHGISEYINRYDHFARFLVSHGFAVVGCDLPGHGQSIWNPDELGYFAEEKGWTLVCKTLRELAEDIRAEYPNLPFFFFGHSMGSFLTRTLMILEPDMADGFILSGTGQPNAKILAAGLRLTELAVRLMGAKGRSPRIERMSMGAYNQQFAPARTDVDWISRDTNEVDRYAADPLCRFTPSVSLFRDMMGGLRFIGAEENMAKMNKDKPIYLFAGDDDPVGEMGVKVRQVFYSFLELGCHNVRCRLYPGGRHEMLNEINKDEVYADVLAWLERHLEDE